MSLNEMASLLIVIPGCDASNFEIMSSMPGRVAVSASAQFAKVMVTGCWTFADDAPAPLAELEAELVFPWPPPQAAASMPTTAIIGSAGARRPRRRWPNRLVPLVAHVLRGYIRVSFSCLLSRWAVC